METYIQKVKYAILPVVAAVGFAFSGLEARAQNNTMDDCATLNALRGDREGEIRARHLANMVRGFDAATAADEADKKRQKEREADAQRLERKIEQTRPVVQEEGEDKSAIYKSSDGKLEIFMCKYWDDNGNGYVDNGEFKGISKNFERSGPINYVVKVNKSIGSKMLIGFLDPNGNSVGNMGESKVERDKEYTLLNNIQDCKNLKEALTKKGVYGTFQIEVYLDGNLKASHDFNINGPNNQDNPKANANENNQASETKMEVIRVSSDDELLKIIGGGDPYEEEINGKIYSLVHEMKITNNVLTVYHDVNKRRKAFEIEIPNLSQNSIDKLNIGSYIAIERYVQKTKASTLDAQATRDSR